MYIFLVSSWTTKGSRRPPYVVHRRTKKVHICDSDSTTRGNQLHWRGRGHLLSKMNSPMMPQTLAAGPATANRIFALAVGARIASSQLEKRLEEELKEETCKEEEYIKELENNNCEQEESPKS